MSTKPPFLLLFFFLTIFHISAQSTSIDSLDIEAFISGVVETHLKNKHVAGAVASVVKDGKLLFAKGYGYADIKNQVPVDPEKTLFRIGSISKLFVWTAIMQLHSQGKLDLDADINKYLKDFKIPATYKTPITLKHLMTHTPGFEDLVVGLFSKDAERVVALSEILKNEMPARVRPPGELASYSNHGTGIAAYIVEQVSGMEWNRYVEQNIIKPLGLQHTTFRQPLPEVLKPHMSNGYIFSGGRFQEKPFEYVPLAPVGAAASTATDMARFMLAHLQLGTLNGVSILDSATAIKMQDETVFLHAPETNPMRYGFMDLSQNGVKIIGHGGDTFWFHSLLAFLPKYNLGIFVSFNSQGGGGASTALLEEFMDRYFPEKLDTTTFSLSPEQLKRYEGEYRSIRYPHKDFSKVAALMGTMNITASEDGTLKVITEEEKEYIPIDKLTFRETNSSNTLVFKEDKDGNIINAFSGLLSIFAFEKTPELERTEINAFTLIASVVIFLITLFVWPLIYFLSKGYLKEKKDRIPTAYKFVGSLAALSFLIFLVGMVSGDPLEIVFGISDYMRVLLWLPYFGAFLTMVAALTVFWIWVKARRYNTLGKIHYTILLLALIAMTGQLYIWNFLMF